jgi:hypothetical protein
VVAVATIALGTIWYGLSAKGFGRLWQYFFDRLKGSMAFRFLLQPAMPSILAIRAGVKDARLRCSPYLRTILSDPEMRMPRVWGGLIATGESLFLGLTIDPVYQHRMQGTFYLGEAAVLMLLLPFLPYLFIRGFAARVVGRSSRPTSSAAR